LEYLDEQDSTPFRRWFNRLNREAAAEVSCALVRLELGYRSKLRAVGAGVIEYRINFGPGYRIYFGRDGDQLIILLGGGTKKQQAGDILQARANWKKYQHRKQRSHSTWH
jgi:putative addiction module killer protein